jgi:hypothetical protein
MDLKAARADLARALGSGNAAARAVLIQRGIEALGTAQTANISLDELIRLVTEAPPSRPRRDFAVLLVHALAIDGPLPARGESERIIRSFLERALLNPLRRAGYPFDGTPYDKRQALARLHTAIDEHLRPLEPTMPRWLQGLGREDDA